jgi:hypothetical protein
MSRFPIIYYFPLFLCKNFSKRRNFFKKSGKFSAAAAEGRKKLKISSSRRRERHRLTHLFVVQKTMGDAIKAQ